MGFSPCAERRDDQIETEDDHLIHAVAALTIDRKGEFIPLPVHVDAKPTWHTIKEAGVFCEQGDPFVDHLPRSEEHTSELQSLMRISYAVFCLKKKTTTT